MKSALRFWLVTNVPTSLHPHLRSVQIVLTTWLGRILRALPGSSRYFGPPRRWTKTLAEYVALRRAKAGSAKAFYVEVRPAQMIRRTPPLHLEHEVDAEFAREAARETPAVGVAAIAHGRVLTSTGAVIGPDDRLIADVSETFFIADPAANPVFLAPKLPPVRRIGGAIAVLTNFRSGIFYHWILDTLPRLHLLDEAGIPYDRVVVAAATRYQRESLELLGIRPDRLISEPGLHLEADTLVVPSLPGVSGNPPDWACKFLRERFLGRLAREGRRTTRIFVSRARTATRRIINEDELLRALEPRGFKRVFLEERSLAEQVRTFNEADIVISPHGSGLTNLVFSEPGATLVEIFSPNYMNVMYWALANQLGVGYWYTRGKGRLSSVTRGRRVHEDITVDVAQVEAIINEIERRRAPRSSLVVPSPQFDRSSGSERHPFAAVPDR
jgi:capsular polysaccharide biosynthesis protein